MPPSTDSSHDPGQGNDQGLSNAAPGQLITPGGSHTPEQSVAPVGDFVSPQTPNHTAVPNVEHASQHPAAAAFPSDQEQKPSLDEPKSAWDFGPTPEVQESPKATNLNAAPINVPQFASQSVQPQPFASTTSPTAAPAMVTGDPQNPWHHPVMPDGSHPTPAPFAAKGKRKSKLFMSLVAAAIVVVVFGGGAAAYYYGYVTNPNAIWSRALSTTASGYDSLVSYLNTQSKTSYKGAQTSGNFSLQSGGTNIDGTLSAQANGQNATGSFTLNLGPTQVTTQFRSIAVPNSMTPDIYLQFKGITGLGDSLGSNFGNAINSLDGQWIAINHTFIEDIESQIPQTMNASTTQLPKVSDIVTAAQSFGTVNKKYVFTTNKNYSVTTVVKKYGTTTINGQKMYHYKVGFVKQNVKAYITALRDALQQSKLGSWIAADTGKSVSDAIDYNGLESSADNISSSDTVDVWVNTKTHLIYKVRASDKTNPAENWADLGLNYTGGSSFPFFVTSQSVSGGVTSTGSLTATINTKTNSFGLYFTVNDPQTSNPTKVNIALNFTPSNAPVSVTAPANSESVSQVMDQLGLTPLIDQLVMNASGSSGDMSSMSMGSSL